MAEPKQAAGEQVSIRLEEPEPHADFRRGFQLGANAGYAEAARDFRFFLTGLIAGAIIAIAVYRHVAN